MGNSGLSGDVFDGVSLSCPFSHEILDAIWDLIESVSEGFPTYMYSFRVVREEKCSSITSNS